MNTILQLKIDSDLVMHKCICPTECDCQNPPPDDWDGKNGCWGISNSCPVHNDYPDIDPECLAEKHR